MLEPGPSLPLAIQREALHVDIFWIAPLGHNLKLMASVHLNRGTLTSGDQRT